MKKMTKIILSLSLTVVFLIACIVSLTLIFFGAWLHTYNALTKETVVAEVVMHPMKTDEEGTYIKIELTPLVQQSALTTLVNPGAAETDDVDEKTEYKLYGDSVAIGGPIVKFHDSLILLNFDTIFKLARVRGFYEMDLEMEKNRTVFSAYDLNGGFDDTWWTINDNEGDWPYNWFIDRVQFSVPQEPGFRYGKPKMYEIVVTKDGFAWNLIQQSTE